MVKGEGYLADDESEEDGEEHPEQQRSDTKPSSAVHKQVRDSLLHLLGLHSGRNPRPPPTRAELREFMEGSGAGPSISPFRLDYNSSSNSPYNVKAFHIFGAFFSALVAKRTFPDIQLQYYMTPQYFATIASSKFRRLKDRYRAVSPPDVDSNETVEAKVTRISADYIQDCRVNRRAGRRVGLLKHRKKLVREDPEESPRLVLIGHLLELLGPTGMSSDETDDASTPQKKQFSRIKSTGQPVPGNSFRHRLYEHHKTSVDVPKTGLPCNVYDPAFLAALPLHRLESLGPVHDLDLSLLEYESSSGVFRT
ncbi:hypothetical protein NM688_g9452 [Phlebia brevispora]|uniref:Uncharacterized protein n=1 Tax=Phlebia brevispora TaxID=194682 RepID=A0ACC1RJ30_9APHY|nr:hypothetical protein NM688_g9452 [Phlebia brevispora]